MAVTVLKNIKDSKKGKASQHLHNAIKYILNPEKTEEGLWIGSNCGTIADEIYNSMLTTKKDYQKEWGRQGYHYVISFPPGECDEATCYAVGKEFCEKYLADNYDYCFAVHNDHDHMHCHIVFNSVNRTTGEKYRYVNGDWEKYIQTITDELCRKYNLPELTYDKKNKRIGKSYAEHAAQSEDKFTWKRIIRLDIDRAVSISNTQDEFYREMKTMGYDIRIGNSEKHGTYIAYHHPAMKEIQGHRSERARRDYKLGSGYTYGDICRRINEANKEEIPADTIYISEKLHTITENRTESRFQACAILRYKHAAQYHYFNMITKDQILVRQDLINIDRLRDECNYLIDHDIGDLDEAEKRLKDVRNHIRFIKEKESDSSYADNLYTEEESAIRRQYGKLQYKMNHSEKLNDIEFESIADQIEEYETKYPDILSCKENQEYRKALEAAMQEKRTLMHIIKDADDTLQVTDVPTIEKQLSRNIVLGNKEEIK